MSEATVTSRGQITIPAAIRFDLPIGPGTASSCAAERGALRSGCGRSRCHRLAGFCEGKEADFHRGNGSGYQEEGGWPVIGLDTNIIVRYLTRNDPKRAKKVTRLIESQFSVSSPGFITLVTLVEVSWVLDSCYNLAKEELFRVLRGVLTTK